jgi:hypothetical protein
MMLNWDILLSEAAALQPDATGAGLPHAAKFAADKRGGEQEECPEFTDATELRMLR